jgi:hypothetical protein
MDRTIGRSTAPLDVMPGLVPGIHADTSRKAEDVDGRDEPGRDDGGAP